jgi:hypothetical protein
MKDAEALEKEGVAWAKALSQMVHAGLASTRGDRAGAAGRLRDAAARCEAADMPLFAEIARRRLGILLGGAEGEALVLGARTWMDQHQVRLVKVDRVTDLFLPGFGPVGPPGE